MEQEENYSSRYNTEWDFEAINTKVWGKTNLLLLKI